MAINFKEYTTTKHSGVSKHKDGFKYLLTVKVNGKLYRKTFKANPAHSMADRLKTAYTAKEGFLQGKEHELNITADVDATVDDYWVKLKKLKSWSPYRERHLGYIYNKHISFLKNRKVKDIGSSNLNTLNASMSHLKSRSRLEAYEILNPLFALAVDDEIIEKSPIKKSHIPKRKQLEEKKIVTDAESKYQKVHESIMTLFGSEQTIKIGDTEIVCHDNPHHRAAFLFGFHGRRLAETLAIKWEDIDFANMKYVIRGENSKVNTDMVFKLPQDVAEALQHFKVTSGEVFNVTYLDKHYKKIRDYTGIPEFSFHWMRNLCVSALAGMGADITDLSAMLGHTDSATIRKYLSLQRESSTSRTDGLSQKLLGK